jgi:biotin carboxyl carrier protein
MTLRVIKRAVVALGDHELSVNLSTDGDSTFVTVSENDVPVQVTPLGPYRSMVRLGQRWVEVFAHVRDGEGALVLDGRQVRVSVADERARQLAALTAASSVGSGKIDVKAPMPGLVVAVPVQVGQVVTKGERLVVLQAMKMENELTSPRDGRVTAIHAAEGQTVEQGLALVTLEGE